MKHLTTFVTEEAAKGAKTVLKLLYEVDAQIREKDTQTSVGIVYELYVGNFEEMGQLALCVECYVLGCNDGFAKASKVFGDDEAHKMDAIRADLQADVDHHEASPWH